ncbi:hypothetical protein, partial [Clostridium botulinum]|uniref:hypothetical protein n=1 Tax=Clostridium botulinum TaxID=1491 RepID=UPI001E4C5D3D
FHHNSIPFYLKNIKFYILQEIMHHLHLYYITENIHGMNIARLFATFFLFIIVIFCRKIKTNRIFWRGGTDDKDFS